MIARLMVVAVLAATACRHKFQPREAAHIEAHSVAVGRPVPVAQFTTASGDVVALDELVKQHDKTVVVFYRGFY